MIAETTTSSGLRSSASKPTEEGLLLCGLAFPHAQGVSSHALKVASDSLAASENNSDWRVPVVVVPDVQADERFASSHLLKIYQDVRFYAAVPIRSPAGAFIGVLSTTDSTPRETLGAVEVDFLQDMSLTIMDHLTMIRHRQEEARGKRMMRGLGSFVEGRATMNGLGSDKWSTQPVGDTGQEGMLNVAQQTKMQEEVQRLNIENIATPRNQELTQSYFESESSPHPETPTASGAERQAPVETDIPRRFSGKSTSTVGTTSPESSTRDIRGLFSRAANTIRESIQVEGVLFFDASVATFGGMVESGRNESSDTPHSNTSQESSSGEEGVRSVTSGKHAALNSTKMCEILGFSTTETASVDGDKPNAVHLAVPERFLRLLLRRYPKGKIFNFDENGIPLSDTSESDSDHDDSARSVTTTTASESSHSRHQHKQSFTRSREPSFIIKVFPNARSVLAFPLWDSHKSRWYAGGVVWTRTPTRVFSVRGELSYLRAFGATIMAEMGKIDAEQANQAKGDVLGSISHELRSPLHGILGGVELLLETSMDVFQDSTVNTIERCGVTLLDTVDHLLDFAKINNLMQASKATRRTRLREGGAPSSNKMERSSTASAWDVDVDAIAEEVVSSIFAGHEFETSRESLDIPRADLRSSDHDVRVSDAGMPSKSPPSTSREMPHDHVKVIFDISPATSWRYSTQVGALRRIVMNVFGNALKYTVAGHIRVHVEQKDLPAKGKDMSEVKITVEDTGKGISKEYLAHHLFTPFSQEDSFSPGTGLGLSITHKIVTSLGGTIDAQSKIGKGSTLTISLPLRHSSSTEQSREKKAFTDLTKRTQGVRVSLSGFDENVTPSVQGISTDFKGWQLFRTAIAHQCQDWLQMDVLPSTETAIKPDIYVATPTGARELADMNQAGVVSQPIVVICPNAAVARHLSTTSKTVDRNGIVEYVSQP